MIWQMNLKNLMLDSYQFSVGLLTIMVKICIDTLIKFFFFLKSLWLWWDRFFIFLEVHETGPYCYCERFCLLIHIAEQQIILFIFNTRANEGAASNSTITSAEFYRIFRNQDLRTIHHSVAPFGSREMDGAVQIMHFNKPRECINNWRFSVHTTPSSKKRWNGAPKEGVKR